MEKNGGAAAPPATGCYKCGRPGHWSRDCPFSNSDSNPNPKVNSNFPRPSFKPTNFPSKLPVADKTIEKPKKPPRTIPKLTPDVLLSEDGLGYVLRHFPKAFKFRGRGHEVEDLGNLIGMYSQWHSHLIPYYSFDQFVKKVEQVGATQRVRACIRDLKDRVAHGGDPSKLHEAPVEQNLEEAVVEEERNDPPSENHDFDALDEEMPDEAAEEAWQSLQNQIPSVQAVVVSDNPVPVPDDGDEMTEEQRARMEANRLKALERAAAARARAASQACSRDLKDRDAHGGDTSKLHGEAVVEEERNDPPPSENHDDDEEMPDEAAAEEAWRSLQNEIPSVIVPDDGEEMTEEQRARMEANRLKALERAAAAARARALAASQQDS